MALTACNTTSSPRAAVPTDGIHFSGAADAVYPIAGGGDCVQNIGAGGAVFLSFSGGGEVGAPSLDMLMQPFAGAGTYEIKPPDAAGSWLTAALVGSNQWHASEGEIVVTSVSGGLATGTVTSAGLVEINTGTKLDVAGSWRCAVRVLPPLAPSPSPISIPVPSPTPPPVGTPVARQALPPATELPLAGLCSDPGLNTADGNFQPLFCRDGSINVVAWRFYAPITPNLLAAGRAATAGQVSAAIRADGKYHPTAPEDLSAYDLASAYYGWTFPHSVVCEAVYSTDNC